MASSKKCVIVPHGHYRDWYGPEQDVFTSRTKLGIDNDKIVLLFLGSIKQYKNIPVLIDLFQKLDPEKYELIIAGNGTDLALIREIKDAAAGLPNIRLELRYLSEQEIPLFLSASNIVILPFSDILNSGSIILSLSYNRKVVTLKKPTFTELEELVGENNIFMMESFNDANEFTEVLDTALNSDYPINLERLAWDKIGRDTATFFLETAETC